jgi:hypothetical protein
MKNIIALLTILAGTLLIITISLASYSKIHHGDYSQTGKYLEQFFRGEFNLHAYKLNN